MFKEIHINMIYIDFNKTDNYYEFIDGAGGKTIIPTSSVILVDDESGYISIKLTASRKTIGLLKKE